LDAATRSIGGASGSKNVSDFHQPYPLCRAEVMAWDEQLLALDGFTPTGRSPDSVLMSRGVDETLFPLESIDLTTGVGTT
jgi:hypothetical protein